MKGAPLDKEGWRKVLEYLVENENEIYDELTKIRKYLYSYI